MRLGEQQKPAGWLGLQEMANEVCSNIPAGLEIQICLERNAGWVQLIIQSERRSIGLPDQADLSLAEQISEALAEARAKNENADTPLPTPSSLTSRDANAIQIGGDHYRRLDPQPWDLFAVYEEIDHFTASAMTYVIRHAHKGGATDLDKAVHWLEKLLEVAVRAPEVPTFGHAMERWKLPPEERWILLSLLTWSDTGNLEHLREAVARLRTLRQERYG